MYDLVAIDIFSGVVVRLDVSVSEAQGDASQHSGARVLEATLQYVAQAELFLRTPNEFSMHARMLFWSFE